VHYGRFTLLDLQEEFTTYMCSNFRYTYYAYLLLIFILYYILSYYTFLGLIFTALHCMNIKSLINLSWVIQHFL